jgi:hypothetical protein
MGKLPQGELEDEESWLRRRVIRFRTMLRYAKDSRVGTDLREFIADAEERLELLEKKKKQRSP